VKAGTATLAQEKRAQLRGFEGVSSSQNAPDSAEGSLNSECKELFVIAQLTFQDTNVLQNPDNRRYTFNDLLKATVANWDIIIERTAAIQGQDPLGFAGVSEMMEQLRNLNGQRVERSKENGLQTKTGRGGTGDWPRAGWIPKRTSKATKTQTIGTGRRIENKCLVHHMGGPPMPS